MIICNNINDIEIIGILHKIYYRFDLINFNMERDAFGVGAAFAEQYISEIEINYNKLINKLNSMTETNDISIYIYALHSLHYIHLLINKLKRYPQNKIIINN